ncbi:substrate-binding domain-containing protein [Blautia sp. MSJ-19]|uniref:substrate-binding domain-containing protein n=1 Tax=Blautia sp. MSJ-19 TaxID=2841517 RepID=UPI001C0F17C4|nr:substrate-binding domain-containing protein [Blautia sp. MSJ-19]MBU5480187.1 substrate-binding domain-containing protein [Blautia sp. MSJ-19]
MKKAAVVVLFLVGAVVVTGENGKMGGFGNFVADVQAEDELPDNDEAQEELVAAGEEEPEADRVSQIDTTITIGAGSRIAVVSKATSGEYWKLVRQGMEDAVKDINTAYSFSSDEAVTMTFEGASDEQDVETQVNTLDAVIAENPTVLCMSAGDIESCQAQLEAASENGIPVVVFDSNVNEDELVAAFRGTDNTYVGKLAAEKLAAAIGGSGKIAIFSAQEKTESSQKRVEGFKEALADYPDITVVSELYTDKVNDMSTAMADVLKRYPDLNGVFCTNESVSDQYLSLEKGEKSPIMVGVDATTAQQKAIAEGQELGTVSQDPYDVGYQTIIAAAQAMSTDDEQAAAVEKNVLLEPEWIDATNIDDPSNSNYLYGK